MFEFNTVEEAVEDLKAGKIILVTDDEDRENEGDFICAAEFATTENVNFMAIAVPKNTAIASGLITKNIPNASNDIPCTSPNDTNTSSLDILKYVISLNTPHTHNAIPTALHMIICDTSGNIVRKRPNTNNAIDIIISSILIPLIFLIIMCLHSYTHQRCILILLV